MQEQKSMPTKGIEAPAGNLFTLPAGFPMPKPFIDTDNPKERPQLKPEIIKGILRKGHKMGLSGPSKAGKSFLLIELAIAIAKGESWLGWECMQGKVLYINMEIDEDSFENRITDVRQTRKLSPIAAENLLVWNLRGKSKPLDKLAPIIVGWAKEQNFDAIIIDPIYKVLTGDENNASQMSQFFGYIDAITCETGASVIYAHHHSKGAQGGKKSMDRASGSGVFARDPDAMIDMIQLELTEKTKQEVAEQAKMDALISTLDHVRPDWRNIIPKQEQESYLRLELAAQAIIDTDTVLAVAEEAEHRAAQKTAWRVECTLREFQEPPIVNCWYDYPLHIVDTNHQLDNTSAQSAMSPRKKGAAVTNEKKSSNAEEKKRQLVNAIKGNCIRADGEKATLEEMGTYINVSVRTVQRYLKELVKEGQLSNDDIR